LGPGSGSGLPYIKSYRGLPSALRAEAATTDHTLQTRVSEQRSHRLVDCRDHRVSAVLQGLAKSHKRDVVAGSPHTAKHNPGHRRFARPRISKIPANHERYGRHRDGIFVPGGFGFWLDPADSLAPTISK